MNREWLKNTLILLPVIGLMGGAGFYLWRDLNSTSTNVEDAARGETVGVLIQGSSNVKRKTGSSLYWNPLKESEALFVNDSIRTGVDSEAVVEFNDKSQINLAENSLIVLEKSASQLSVDFKTGDIEATGGSQKLAIKVKDSLVESENAKLKLSTDSRNNTEIVVTKGKATLTDKEKKKVELSNRKGVNVDEKGNAKQMAVSLILNTPKDKTVVLDPDLKANLPFTWTVLDEEIKVETLEVSNDETFKELAAERTGHQNISALVSRGSHFWRVSWKGRDGTNQFSPSRAFKLDEDKRLVLSSPSNRSTIDLELGKDTVNFSWISVGDAVSFVVEIAKDEAFKTLVSSQSTAQKTVDINGFREGSYFWRVRAFNDANKEIGKSSQFTFNVQRLLPQLPVLTSPQNGFRWTLNDPLNLEWKAADIAKSYRLSVATDAAFRNISYQGGVTANSYLWKWTKPRAYYWQVECLNEAGEVAGKSVTQKFEIFPTVSGPAIVLRSPTNQETVKRDRRDPMDPVVFSWNVERPIASGPFTFLLSEKPDFSSGKRKEGIETTKFALRLDRSANYYWRVEWTNPTDKTDHETSVPFVMKYRVSATLPAPTLVEPLHQAKRSIATKQPLEFRWQKVMGATLYRFTLERESGASKERIPVMSQTTKDDAISSVPLEPGSYYWNVTSLDQQKVEGPASETRFFYVELNKELSAPKLKAPVIK